MGLLPTLSLDKTLFVWDHLRTFCLSFLWLSVSTVELSKSEGEEGVKEGGGCGEGVGRGTRKERKRGERDGGEVGKRRKA